MKVFFWLQHGWEYELIQIIFGQFVLIKKKNGS